MGLGSQETMYSLHFLNGIIKLLQLSQRLTSLHFCSLTTNYVPGLLQRTQLGLRLLLHGACVSEIY